MSIGKNGTGGHIGIYRKKIQLLQSDLFVRAEEGGQN